MITIEENLPTRRQIQGRPHIKNTIVLQGTEDFNQPHEADHMIGGDRGVEGRTPDNCNMESGNNNEVNQSKMVNGNKNHTQWKSYNLRSRGSNVKMQDNNVDFERIEVDDTKQNDDNEDMHQGGMNGVSQGDVNCISGHPTNEFSLSGGQPRSDDQTQHQRHRTLEPRLHYNPFYLDQHMMHQQACAGWPPVYFVQGYPPPVYSWGYQY